MSPFCCAVNNSTIFWCWHRFGAKCMQLHLCTLNISCICTYIHKHTHTHTHTHMQAVLASDFNMARFQFLKKLLLVHGHWCYSRLANMMLYFFYKNVVSRKLSYPVTLFAAYTQACIHTSMRTHMYTGRKAGLGTLSQSGSTKSGLFYTLQQHIGHAH